LVGFERTFLKAGETKTVRFKVQPKQLAQINADVKMEVNPGEYTFSVGGAQPNEERIKAANVVVSTVTLKGYPFKIQN
ncbi:MAG: fibronectin type III-like domain-contianing protein, partial [Bacteroidetes bacterium]|nr:fibronectin type III-like domain-contianing protein [Bacteroidota bacterium]